MGLALNESKTLILGRDRYVQHLGQLVDEDYGEAVQGAGGKPTPNAVNALVSELGAALQISDPEQRRTRLEDAQAVRTVRRAIRTLTEWEHPAGLTFGRAIINRHPALTQNYARYARVLAEGEHGDEVDEYLEDGFPRMVLTEWQELWLLEPLVIREEHGESLSAWIQRRLEDPSVSSSLRARALLAGARSELVEPDYILRVLDSLPAVAQPDAIAAYAAASQNDTDVDRLAGLPDAELASWIFDSTYADNDVS